MKYFVFAFDCYYPQGGAQDCISVEDTPEDAEAIGNDWKKNFDFVHIAIIDGTKLRIVAVNQGIYGWRKPYPLSDQKPIYPKE